MVEPKTIYLEADEEVTSVIDKLRKTEFKDIILVVPKEASLLQSVVNLKLIKKQAEGLGKSVSLITQDKVGRNLAEKVGLATASKVGQEPKQADTSEDEPSKASPQREAGPIEDTNEVVFKKNEPSEEIPEEDLIVSEDEDTEAEADWHKQEIEEKQPKNLMPKFPKKKFLFIGIPIVLILLIIGFIFLPRAKATILMDAKKSPVSVDFSGKKGANLDTKNSVIPSQLIEVTKTENKQYTASGQENIGNKATGSLTIDNHSGSNISWVAGTRFSPTSNSSIVFRASSDINAPNNNDTTVPVVADQPGDQYNGFNEPQPFTLVVGGLQTGVSIYCENGMSGGTNQEVSVVTQADVNTATSDLNQQAINDATSDFNQKVSNLKVLSGSKKESTVSASSSPAVNGQGNNFTMTVEVSIQAIAYNMDDVSALIKNNVNSQLGSMDEIIDDGSSNAQISVSSSDLSTGSFSATVDTTAYVSSKLDIKQIKAELEGDSVKSATTYITGLDGVKDVKFQFWPSFIKVFPRLESHIYITTQVANNSGN